MEYGNGRKLMDDFYGQYNIKSLSAGNTGTQMGGWYRKEIKAVADLKGLRMRVGGGLLVEALQKLGVQAYNMPISEAYQALEKGRLDVVEFVGPYDDQKLGFGKIAPYYYYPGWWEGGAELAYFINAKVFTALTPELRAMVEGAAALAANLTAKYLALNPAALKKLLSERVQLRAFPRELMDAGFGRDGNHGRARGQVRHVQENPPQPQRLSARSTAVGPFLGISLCQLYERSAPVVGDCLWGGSRLDAAH